MRRALSACLVCLAVSAPLHADAPHPVAAVGIVRHAEPGGCTGVLVAPDLVLTAAHCLPDDASAVTFRPGTYTARHDHLATGVRLERHPLFDSGTPSRDARVAFDLALVRLATPIPDRVARPLAVLDAVPPGARFIVASYRGAVGDRARERSCPVLERGARVIVLGCDFAGGESGAPLLAQTEAGLGVAGILTNAGETGTRKFGLAAPAYRAGQLESLMELPPEGS